MRCPEILLIFPLKRLLIINYLNLRSWYNNLRPILRRLKEKRKRNQRLLICSYRNPVHQELKLPLHMEPRAEDGPLELPLGKLLRPWIIALSLIERGNELRGRRNRKYLRRHELNPKPNLLSKSERTQSAPFRETKNKSIDVSLGPQFNQSSSMMSSTEVEESEEETIQSPPIYDPRRSGLRFDDPENPPPEEDKTEESDTPVAEEDDRSISNAEIEVTAPAVTDSEVEEPTPVVNTTLTQDEVFDSAQKFEESLRVLMEKTQNEGEESYVVLPKHFFEGDDVGDLTRSVLDELDPYDPATTKTDALAQKVKDLIESTAAAAQTNAEQTSKAMEEGTSEASTTDILSRMLDHTKPSF